MSSRFRPHIRRIAFALALSALIHGLVLWFPHIKLPRYSEELPPLMAKLEPLPNPTPVSLPAQKPKPTPKVTTVPELTSSIPIPTPSSAIPETETLAASAPEMAMPSTTTTEASSPLPVTRQTLFPQHAQLVFSVHRGVDGFKLGEVQHNLDIINDRYTVRSSTRTTGIVRLFKSYNLNQSSYGTVTAKGLRPDTFSEEKSDSDNWETLSATFDWISHYLYFSQGGEAPLIDGAQDSLSILYQLSITNLNAEVIPVTISDGKKLEDYTLEIGINYRIPTSLGELNTVHLQKVREPGKPGLEIWLSKEHRLLPVKIQYIEPDGSVTATLSITDLRVSDDRPTNQQKN